MRTPVRIALDAMGGDHGPEVIVPGAALALSQHSDMAFLFFGDQARLKPLVAAHPALACRLDDPPLRCGDQNGRQAEPSLAGRAAHLVDVARNRGGQGGENQVPLFPPATPAR